MDERPEHTPNQKRYTDGKQPWKDARYPMPLENCKLKQDTILHSY